MMLRDSVIRQTMIKMIPLPIGKNKTVPCLFEDELEKKVMTEFVALRPKAYSC